MTTTTTTPLDLRATLTALARYFPQTDKIDIFSAKLAERPAQNTLMAVGLSAVLFYLAERNANPKVNTIYDALEYCSSSLSVGYTSIFPQTPVGKLVATALMTYGPALSGAMLDGPKKSQPPEDPALQQKILATLEQILTQLRQSHTPLGSHQRLAGGFNRREVCAQQQKSPLRRLNLHPIPKRKKSPAQIGVETIPKLGGG